MTPYALLGLRRHCGCGSKQVLLADPGLAPLRLVNLPLPSDDEDPDQFPDAAKIVPGLNAKCAGCGKDVVPLMYAVPHDPE